VDELVLLYMNRLITSYSPTFPPSFKVQARVQPKKKKIEIKNPGARKLINIHSSDTPLMTQRRKSFGENIPKLIFRGNVVDDDLINFETITNKVIPYIDVL
jgi:hypothetical protein